MAGRGRSVTKADPCPICGRDNWCRWWPDRDDPNVRVQCCFRYPTGEITAPSGWRTSGSTTTAGGQAFVPVGFNPERRTTPEQLAKRKLDEDAFRQRSIESARKLWARTRGGANHPRTIAYMEARGVHVDRLPGGKLPVTLRFIAECFRSTPSEEKGKEPTKEKLPAIVCAVKGPDDEICGVQRIYLSPAGLPKKCPTGEAKKALGSITGGAVRLNGPSQTGILILCEGVETGLAILAAVGDRATVWCCVSTAGLMGLVLPPKAIDPSTGWIKRIIVAADADAFRGSAECGPGEHAANICHNQLLRKHTHLGGRISIPAAKTHKNSAALFDGKGMPANGAKSVDWLDVFNAIGAEDTAKAVMGPWIDSLRDQAWRLWPDSVMERARIVLEEMFRPIDRTQAAWCLSRWGGSWWVSQQRGRGRWWKVDDEFIEQRTKRLMDRFYKLRKKSVSPLQPSTQMAAEVLLTAINYVGCTSESTSCWLPNAFDKKGDPLWLDGFDFDDWRDDGLVPVDDVFATADGLIDLGAFHRGELNVLPPTSRWFSPYRSPVKLPLEDIRKALRADAGDEAMPETQKLIASLCPEWLEFIHWQFDADDDEGKCVETQQRWWGYCLTSDTRLQKMMWNQGDPGQGKGTHVDVFIAVMGEESMAQTDVDSLAERFDMASLVGRRTCYIPEVRVGDRNTQLALNRLLALSANDRVSIEDKFQKKRQGVRLNIKFWLTPNVEPRLHDDSVAILRRLIVNPITRKKPKRVDPFLADRLKSPSSLAGILLWAMVGNKALREDLARGGNGLAQPERGLKILKDIELKSSPMRHFISECCVTGPKFTVAKRLMVAKWNQWAKLNGYKEMNAQSLGTALRAAVFDYDSCYVSPHVGASRQHMYIGFRPLIDGELVENASKLPANADEKLGTQQDDTIPWA
jgi:P4 family phage/plasmid primase-like protien